MNENVPPVPTGYGATRLPSISTRVALGSNPRSEIDAAPGVNPVALFEIGTPFALATGRLRNSSSAFRSPDLLIKSRLMFKTGFGPTSSAVGMFEPVTMTRSASAWRWPAALASPPYAGVRGVLSAEMRASGVGAERRYERNSYADHEGRTHESKLSKHFSSHEFLH